MEVSQPQRSITPEKKVKSPAKDNPVTKSVEWEPLSNGKKNNFNQTFPKSRSGAVLLEDQQRPLSSSVRHSQEGENSSSKKHVKFVNESTPKSKLQESIIISDSLQDTAGKVFIVHTETDEKNYRTNNFYQKEEHETLEKSEEKHELVKKLSNPKLRIVAPGVGWEENQKETTKANENKLSQTGGSSKNKKTPIKEIVKKPRDSRSIPRDKHTTPQADRTKSTDKAVDSNKKDVNTRESSKSRDEEAKLTGKLVSSRESPSKTHLQSSIMTDNLNDHRRSILSTKSSRFDESNELLKSIYEFNKSSRQQ